ncbi:hypothetical protein [Streptomyces sp. NPDC048496]|uniref:hypothetical protein n=1 Tax=Streptomyces sp. NPDC048496 TaxID=3365558 RepID=UPI0037187A68
MDENDRSSNKERSGALLSLGGVMLSFCGWYADYGGYADLPVAAPRPSWSPSSATTVPSPTRWARVT